MREGWGRVAQDVEEAARWLRISGEAGDRASQTDLTDLVLDGTGGPEDPARVAQWFGAGGRLGRPRFSGLFDRSNDGECRP
jgi:TPR repeat protein